MKKRNEVFNYLTNIFFTKDRYLYIHNNNFLFKKLALDFRTHKRKRAIRFTNHYSWKTY